MRRRSPRRCLRPSARASRARRKFRSRSCRSAAASSVGPFDVEFVSMAHSIPESNALIIRTPAGTVLHTGDWKIDPTPILGDADRRGEAARAGRGGLPRARRRFHQCRARGPLAVGNRRRQDPRRTDQDRARPRGGDDLRLQCGAPARGRRRRARRRPRGGGGRPRHGAHHPGRARDRLSRRRAGFPRASMPTAICRRDKVVALCTGSQGEPRAALARIAEDQHPDVDAVARRPRDLLRRAPSPATRRRSAASSTG